MTGQTIGAGGVHVAGSFQGWDPPSSPQLFKEGSTNIYSATVPNIAGYIEYKFIGDNVWSTNLEEKTIPAACRSVPCNQVFTS